jgi:hypothetical protein
MALLQALTVTLAAQQVFSRASKQPSIFDRIRRFMPNARGTFPLMPSIATNQALVQFGSEHSNSIESTQRTLTLLRAKVMPARPD